MAYSTSLPPRLIPNTNIDGVSSPNMWVYSSADAQATVAAASYITNAKDLGMRVNDQITVIDTATPKITSHQVTAVASTGSTLSTGVQIS